MFSTRLCTFAAVLGLSAAFATACTSDDKADQPSPTGVSAPTPAATTATTVTIARPNARLDVEIAQLAGGVRRDERRHWVRVLARPIATWFDGAYLGGSYPREDFSAGYDLWTPQAAALGMKDGTVTSNAALGRDVVAVVADRQRARLYVFATRGKVGGATARVSLRLTAQQANGSLEQVSVNGDLYLTRTDGSWLVFGYDLDRSVVPL